MKRNIKTIELWEANNTAEEGTDAVIPLKDFLEAMAKIPPEIAAQAVVRVHATGDYSYGYLSVTHDRPETDAEYNQRVAQHEHYLRQHQEQERETYERLKRKYEGQ